MSKGPTHTITYEELENTDVLDVELIPERKGLILKHCEYYVSSRKYGTTVNRRYNDFANLYDVLLLKYPYRAIPRLPPKRVVVGGGSARFLQRRRAALQRWLTLVARHPVLAHDADVRLFLCEAVAKLEKPKHDEFMLAGSQEISNGMTIEQMEETFESQKEQLKIIHLGLSRLFEVFEKAENRLEAERLDMRSMGSALTALATPAANDAPAWTLVRDNIRACSLATSLSVSGESLSGGGDGGTRLLLATQALEAWRALCGRMSRGVHAERASAAPRDLRLRTRHCYALAALIEEAEVCAAYGLAALLALRALFHEQAEAHAQLATQWRALHDTLARSE